LAWLLALLGLALAAEQTRAAAPPVSPRWLAGELRQLEQLEARSMQAVMASDFKEALRLSRQALAARRRLQGASHWQAIDTRLNVQRWDRLTKVPAKDRPQVALALRKLAAGQELISRRDLRGASKAFQEALAILRKVLGEDHPETANGCNKMAGCLYFQGQYAEARRLVEKALAVRRKVLGEDHPDTALSCIGLATCLAAQGQHPQARPLYHKALAIYRKALGEEHPVTAQGYIVLGLCLQGQGKHALALQVHQKGLAIHRKTLGEKHPLTVRSHDTVARCLAPLGKHAEAIRHWQAALPGYDAGRHGAAASGFDRARFDARRYSPRERLAVTLARLGRPIEAWEYAESSLARGLLDELASDRGPFDLGRIQKQIPADAALVLWLDIEPKHWGCVVRRQGPPVWERLPGTGPGRPGPTSACESGLGQQAGGEGLLGFAQAFLAKGARSVVLSRWKVDDTATALLTVRFYENLLGKRAGLKRGMGRMEALGEAKSWLRGLKRAEAGELAARLAGGVLRGTEKEARPLVKGKEVKLPEGERPFAHPYYWAAFVLIGDPS
jgi:tetratricopeptide (TPR) repeat protein